MSIVLDSRIESLLKQRYYHPNENSWDQVVERIVENICSDESEEYKQKIRVMLLGRVWLPNSPAIVNAGKENSGLMACFVAGPTEDTLENHAETLMEVAQVGKAGGGCGFTGSFIRPENSPVAGSAHGFAYGPNNWAVQVNNYLDMITQGGFRKMALMYTLDCRHKDIEKFLNLKQTGDETHAARFNQSVMATDKWMTTAVNDSDSEEHRLLKLIAKNAWQNGEPGLLFFDTINNNTPYKDVGATIYATNPCGEQPLPPYGSCNLGSLNLAHNLLLNEHNGNKSFNYPKLEQVVKGMTRFLDNVGSKNVFPSKKFQDWYEDFRPIGIGVMGFADLLLKMGYRYGDKNSQLLLSNIMKTIYNSAKEESELLGKERGIPDGCRHVNRRNITLVSIAPTGSIAFIAGCSHGIEPIFSPSYTRTDERGENYVFVHPLAEESYFMSTINNDKDKIPTWQEHIDIQAIAQKHCDSGISKTINFEENATIDDVYNAMVYAWESGTKGITVYRNNSRKIQVLTDNNSIRETEQQIHKNNAPKRPKELPCKIFNTSVKGEYWVVLIGFLGNDPYEIFAYPNGRVTYKDGIIVKRGKGNYDLKVDDKVIIENIPMLYENDEQVALTRMISTGLRHGASLKFIVEQLEKSGGTIVSFSKAVNRALKSILPNGETLKLTCQDCGSDKLAMQEGCLHCESCGSSKCA